MMANNSTVCNNLTTVKDGSYTTSAAMFSMGVLGNVLALVLLEVRRRRRQSASVFQVLVTALVITDLLGTFSVSPLVITSYAMNRTMIDLGWNGTVCAYFGFAWTYLSLVTLAILLLMAVERWLAIGHPYFYKRRVSLRCGSAALILAYVACALFCLPPFFRFNGFVQFCPGTWCFINLHTAQPLQTVYKNVYASCLLLMIVFTVLCNASVSYHLLLMYRRRKAHRGSFYRQRSGPRNALSITEEVDHLVLLGFMIFAFIIFSLPLVVRVYISSSNPNDKMDRIAFLMLSINPIIVPWVFIILSPPVPRLLWGMVFKAPRPQRSPQKPQRTASSPSVELQK